MSVGLSEGRQHLFWRRRAPQRRLLGLSGAEASPTADWFCPRGLWPRRIFSLAGSWPRGTIASSSRLFGCAESTRFPRGLFGLAGFVSRGLLGSADGHVPPACLVDGLRSWTDFGALRTSPRVRTGLAAPADGLRRAFGLRRAGRWTLLRGRTGFALCPASRAALFLLVCLFPHAGLFLILSFFCYCAPCAHWSLLAPFPFVALPPLTNL